MLLVCLCSWTVSSETVSWVLYSPLGPQGLALSRHSLKSYGVNEQMDN